VPRRLVIGAAALAALAFLAPSGGSAPAAPKRAALYLSPNGSDGGPCTRSAPCRTFDRAYHRARPGQVVQLAGGTYPAGQEMTYDPSKRSSKDVIFRVAPRAVATVARRGGDDASLDIRGASHITFQRIRIAGDLGITPTDDGPTHYASDVSVVGGKLTTIHLRSARYVTFRNLEVGNFSYAQGRSSSWFSAEPGGPPSSHVVVDHVLWHNIHTDGSPTHPECLIVDAVNGIIIRNSRFVACPVMSLFFSGDSGYVARNVLVENNVLSCGGGPWHEDCGATINFRPDYPFRNITIRFNSISGLLYMQSGSYSNVRVYGNVISGQADCRNGVSFAYNIVSHDRCGATDRVGSPGFVNEARTELMLRPGAAAVNFVPPALCSRWTCPKRDIRGHRRVGRRDAGAYEIR